MEENEKLLEEKRELLRKISEAEEMGSNGMRTASTVQHRYLYESLFTCMHVPAGDVFELLSLSQK